MKISKKEIANVLAQVESELASVLKSEQDAIRKLSKADEGSAGGPPDEGSAGGPPPGGPEGSAGGPPDEGSAGGPPPGGPEAGGPPGAPPGGPEVGAEGAEDPAMDAGPADPAALQAEYEKLSAEELQMHLMACKAALEAKMGAAGAGGPPPGGPEAGGPPMGGPPAGGPPPGPPMGKKEMPSHETNGDVEKKLGKMEATITEANEKIELLSKALELAIGRPVRKAFTGKDLTPSAPAVDPKSLSKAEITERLKKKASDPNLAKNDRNAINAFYSNAISVDGIAHLLK